MLQRLSVVLRGPGMLLLIVGVAILLTAAGREIHPSHSHGAASAPRSTPTSTATPSPRPKPSATPRPMSWPAVVYALSLGASHPLRDGHTGMEATVGRALTRPGHSPGSVRLLLAIRIHNRGRQPRPYSHTNFYAVDLHSGQTYGATAQERRLSALGAGKLGAGRSVSRWIGFDLPGGSRSLMIIWNDDNHLLPPGIVVKVRIGIAR